MRNITEKYSMLAKKTLMNAIRNLYDSAHQKSKSLSITKNKLVSTKNCDKVNKL